MKPICLVREVTVPNGSGPMNGQYALQRALRAVAPDWFHIRKWPHSDEIPWLWHWDDAGLARFLPHIGYIAGPNILFHDSRNPNSTDEERLISSSPACRLLVTESEWYRDLIQANRTTTCPIAVWPYPIDPMPDGPLPVEFDLLIFAKWKRSMDHPRGYRGFDLVTLKENFPRSRLLHYGRFARSELIDAARRSRCCVYWSDDDRGPLALAEILLCGCPAVGMLKGAPWIDGSNGVVLPRFALDKLEAAIGTCHGLDREAVRDGAVRRFSSGTVAQQVVAALEPIAYGA